MKIKTIGWGGTRTENFSEMVGFLRDVLGLDVSDEAQDFVSFRLGDGTKFEVFGPEEKDHDFFTTGPVVGFGVDDVDEARTELEKAGVDFIGPTHSEGQYKWAHFRGPDGNVYEIATS
ncbi:MAG: VOC family protein [Actinomycetota bacterium]|nr:VOC family protein [Actinomycetota bacterium]